MTGSIDSSECLRSMWRLICLAFFGAFAWGVTWGTYGAQISEHTTKIINAVKVHIPPKYLCSCFASLQTDTPQCGGALG